MGKLHITVTYLLGLLCASAFAFPQVANAGRVSVEVSPTTGYTSTTSSTFAPPARSSTSAIQDYKATFGPLSGGGAYQTMQSGITITGIKENSQTLTSTVSSRLRATAGAMKNGLSRCFTSFRCNAVLMVGGAGVQALIDEIGWLIDEGGQVRRKGYPPAGDMTPCSENSICFQRKADPSQMTSNPMAACSWFSTDYYTPPRYEFIVTGFEERFRECVADRYDAQYNRWNYGAKFSLSVVANIFNSGGDYPFTESPVSKSDIESAIDSKYNPDPSDLPFLASGGLDFSHDGVDIEIIDIPSVTGANSPNYVEYSDGTSKGTYSEYEFSWGAPSKQPEISVDERTTETTYSSTGEPTGTTTTTSSSSGSSANNPPEVPTDCDFMPTVCRFIDWFTEPDPELSQDADFSQLIDDVDIERDFSVGSSTASCPAPFVINLSWVPSVEVSLQPFCDFADLLRPVLLALAYLVSGAIILRT